MKIFYKEVLKFFILSKNKNKQYNKKEDYIFNQLHKMGCCDSRVKEPTNINKESYEVKSISVANRCATNEAPVETPMPESKQVKNEFDTFANNKLIGMDDLDFHENESQKSVKKT